MRAVEVLVVAAIAAGPALAHAQGSAGSGAPGSGIVAPPTTTEPEPAPSGSAPAPSGSAPAPFAPMPSDAAPPPSAPALAGSAIPLPWPVPSMAPAEPAASDAAPAAPSTAPSGAPGSPERAPYWGPPRSAWAEVVEPIADDRNAWELRRIGLALHTGGGTPVGLLGLTADYAVVPQLSLGGGAGEGDGPPGSTGLRGALTARARPDPGKENAFVVGAAYSFGNYKHTNWDIVLFSTPPSYTSTHAQWAQVEVGWEHRGKKGFLMGLTIGAAWLLNPSAVTCTQAQPTGGFFSSAEPCQAVDGERLVTLDFMIGYAFDG